MTHRLRPVEDKTSADQRAYYYALTHMIADGEQPLDPKEMTERIKALRREQRRVAAHLGVTHEQWQAECARRLQEVLSCLGYVEV